MSPAVRDLYPSTSKYGRRGVGNGNGRSAAPAGPTAAAPGTPEKVNVMAQRAKFRQSLWHPLDAGFEGGIGRAA